MKKILISAVAASAMMSSLSAIEVYKDGNNSVEVYGTLRNVLGYGHSFNSRAEKNNGVSTSSREITGSDILFGIQGNSRVGMNFKYNGFIGGALIALNEKTFQNSTSGTPGFRQLYGGYDFGSAGKLIIGKIETLTTMNFSSDIFDGDSGMNGFGGTTTSTRRFQVQYSLPIGLSFAVSESELTKQNTTELKVPIVRKSIPRVSLSYDYKSESLLAKVAATYTHGETYQNKSKDAFLVTAGVKPSFGAAYISTLLTYGLNADLMGEMKTPIPGGFSGRIGTLTMTTSIPDDVPNFIANDVSRYAGLFEFGYSITENFKTIIGAGYQLTTTVFQSKRYNLHSYAAFLQLPYSVSKNFTLIPQVGYAGLTYKNALSNKNVSYTNAGGMYALMQARFNF
ncbi:hypothetical protein [Helicobacter sp. MIT 14-3879]|uniref:hypothetical protein n=1 Tax=Helicobacter sp. MIT 14-3879 TaxID=2040649 RepID=UPI000E1F3983|nr:hypothetical protein [Helicobacter sp. MIT 14-3879]RDU62900.1 hypothetical protein CQA44_06285 [Helicobacter sp. MIT 14-3879]